jgi:hypothetical protein
VAGSASGLDAARKEEIVVRSRDFAADLTRVDLYAADGGSGNVMRFSSESPSQIAGTAAIIGGVLGVVVAPFMVIVKYQTGWSVIPEPAWIAIATPLAGTLANFGTPVTRWIVYGSVYTLALLLMFVGLLAVAMQIKERTGRAQPIGLWVLLLGLCLVIVGDGVHTATWHQNGLTVPTPGTNPVANAGYATHMMGMNLMMAGSLIAGISGLRHQILARWLAWTFVFLPATIVAVSLTLLPTTPSGGLWIFSVVMIAIGYSLRSGRPHLITPEPRLSPELERQVGAL